MAILGRWTGGVNSQGDLPETWTAPTNLFDTEDRNDSSAYTFTASTSTLTLPSSGLADGYLMVAAFEYEDTSNGRFNPQGQIIQASGTGTHVGSPTGGYNRDASEDRSYVRCWAFVDNPSASSTYQFQWKADVDDATGGTVRSVFEVIPFYYSDIGLYTSTTAALYGGTTPNQVTGFSGTDGTNITLTSNVVTVTGDNKRYLVLGSQFFEGRGGRTQRWHGFRIDGTKDDAAKAYSYYRNTSNDESGDLFTTLIETGTADVTIDQFCYRGDGVANGQGGADIDGSTPTVGDHAIVVIELNDSAEVFASRSDTTTGDLTNTSGTNMPVNEQVDVQDTASFTTASDTAVNCVKTADYLFGANISMAANNVANTGRHTMYSEMTVNGTPNADTVAGDYLRNNQASTDTFGLSNNLLNFLSLTAGDDVGVETFTLTGSEAQGDPISPAGWTGFWGINLDTLEAGGGPVFEDMEATLDGTSTLTASLYRDRDLESTNDGTSALTASLYVNRDLESTVDGTSSVNADLNRIRSLSATLDGTSSLSATTQRVRDLSTLIEGTSALAATLNKQLDLSANIDGTSALTADIDRIRNLASSIDGSSSVVAELNRVAGLSASIDGSSSLTATLNRVRDVSASLDGTSSLTANLAAIINMSATIGASSGMTATLSAFKDLAVPIMGTSAVDATLNRIRDIVSTLDGTSSVVADLTVTGPGGAIIDMEALIQGTSSISATLERIRDISASIQGAASLSAELTVLRIIESIIDSGNLSSFSEDGLLSSQIREELLNSILSQGPSSSELNLIDISSILNALQEDSEITDEDIISAINAVTIQSKIK